MFIKAGRGQPSHIHQAIATLKEKEKRESSPAGREKEEEEDDMENSRLCSNGCGFFGTPETRSLCSKCYRDFLKSSENEKARADHEASSSSSSDRVASAPMAPPVSSSDQSNGKPVHGAFDHDSTTKRRSDRCGMCKCKKKVGVIGFKCRCGIVFCSEHRLPEKHGCSFDYKATGREILMNQNPLVKANKLPGRI